MPSRVSRLEKPSAALWPAPTAGTRSTSRTCAASVAGTRWASIRRRCGWSRSRLSTTERSGPEGASLVAASSTVATTPTASATGSWPTITAIACAAPAGSTARSQPLLGRERRGLGGHRGRQEAAGLLAAAPRAPARRQWRRDHHAADLRLFLAETTTGHFNGVITIDVSEANAVERERQRQWLDESYRSLLGHFRHESGHYYWMRLVDGTRWLEPFRRMFGDERADYAAALAGITRKGPRPVGPPTTSPPTPARTRPRTGRRPGRTTSTSSTFSTQRWRSASSIRRGGCCAVLDPGSARSMPIARRRSGSSTSGSRSRSP